MSAGQSLSRDHHTAIPAKPDLIRLGIGMIGIGTSGPLIALSGMPILTLIFWRNLGASIITLPFALRHARDRTGVKWSMIAGVLLALHFIGFFLAMRMTSVAAGTALVALQPVFTAIFVKLRGGHIPSSAWLGMVISFIGVVLVSGVDLQLSIKAFTGDLFAIVSGALSAAYLMAGAKAQQTLETSAYTTIAYFTCALTALPLALFNGDELFKFSLSEWLILLGLIVGAQLLGHTMFNSVLKRVSPVVVSLIVFFEVPLSAILAFWWLGQKPPLGIIPGIALILFGSIFVVSKTKGIPND
jgi:drug/metabolite transporter (DMT)-like permease